MAIPLILSLSKDMSGMRRPFEWFDRLTTNGRNGRSSSYLVLATTDGL